MNSVKEHVDQLLRWAGQHPRVATGIAAATCLGIACYIKRKASPNLPPGPRGWPLVGSMFSLSDRWHVDFMNMREQYGDVFCFYLGST